MNRVKLAVASIVGVVGSAVAMVAHGTTFSTTSLDTAIGQVSGTTYDYFLVLIASFWPFLLGAVILVGVIVFGKRIIHSMFGK